MVIVMNSLENSLMFHLKLPTSSPSEIESSLKEPHTMPCAIATVTVEARCTSNHGVSS